VNFIPNATDEEKLMCEDVAKALKDITMNYGIYVYVKKRC